MGAPFGVQGHAPAKQAHLEAIPAQVQRSSPQKNWTEKLGLQRREGRGRTGGRSIGALLCPVSGILLAGSFAEVAPGSFQHPSTSGVPSRRVPHVRVECLS